MRGWRAGAGRLRDRLFKPHEIIGLEALAPAHGGIEFHQTVGVDHQLRLVADRLAYCFDPRFVFRRVVFAMLAADAGRIYGAANVRSAYLDLQPGLTFGGPVFCRFDQFLACVGPQPEGDVGRNGFLRASQ